MGAVWDLPANPAQFVWIWAGLNVLSSRRIPNGSQKLFLYFSNKL